jgi:hypothetical protein
MGTLALLNPKENNILFGSVHFNLGISIQFKFNRVAFNSTCNYAKFIQMKLSFHKTNSYFLQFIFPTSVQQCKAQAFIYGHTIE